MARKVLIVDDSEINRSILANILCNDYELLEAENGQLALDILLQEKEGISAVILDIMMPVMDGFTMLAEKRKIGSIANIPVLVVTSATDVGVEVKALALGAIDFIAKPYNSSIIKHRVHNTIQLRENAAIVNATKTDALTGLYSRSEFFAVAKQMIEQKPSGYYVMTCLDIDGFKVINDQYGNGRGDEVLKHIADCIKRGFNRLNGICCRIMADNFAVLYPTNYVNSTEIRLITEECSYFSLLVQPIIFSIGRYIVDDITLSCSAMYDRAVMAKTTIKGRYDKHSAIYDESMRLKLLREQEIANHMQEALSERQFEVWFQPQYNHANGTIFGAEALVRWRHPTNGLVAPDLFIPVFERNGFIYEMDKFVWEESCRLLRKWLDLGYNPPPCSVNISRYDIFKQDFVSVIKGFVEKYKIPIDLLRLEITESAFAKSTEQIITVVKELIAYGFTMEIDDFGSGYSSLNTLKDVPATVLKLDMRFLHNDKNSARGGHILESITRMAKWLGMTIIAEGVETIEQADYLKSIGCSLVQGYLYARPIPADKYESLMITAPTQSVKVEMTSLSRDSFWDPNSMDTLIFNSYVGGACIYEYGNGKPCLLRVNDKYAKMLGGESFTAEQVLKLDWVKHIDDENMKIIVQAMEDAIRTNEEITLEITLDNVLNDNKKTYIKAQLRLLVKTADRYLFYVIVNNITAQKEAEIKKRQLSEQMQIILKNVSGGISAATLIDGRVNYVFANEHYYEMFGYTKEQFMTELDNGIIDLIHPSDVQMVIDAANKAEGHNTATVITYRAFKRDRSMIWVLSNGTVCHIDDVNQAVHLAVTTDITNEKESERKIADGAEILRFLNDCAHILMAETDSKTGVCTTLEKMLAYFKGDCAYVIETDTSKNQLNVSFRAGDSERHKKEEGWGNLTLRKPEFWIKLLQNEAYIAVSDINQLTQISTQTKKFLSANGVHSLIVVPMLRNKKVVGFIAVENAQVNLNHVSLLVGLGDYISIMLLRRDLTAKIESDNKMLSELMNDTPGGFNQLRLMSDGRILHNYINDGFCKQVKSTREQIRARCGDDAMNAIHPYDKTIVKAFLSELVKNGKSTAKYRIMCEDGTYVRFLVFGRLIVNQMGEKLLNIYYADINDKLQLEELSQEIMDNIPTGMGTYRLHKDGRIEEIYLNDGFDRLVGVNKEQRAAMGYSGFSTLNAVHPDDVGNLRREIVKGAQTLTGVNADIRMITNDKNYKWLSLRSNVIAETDDTYILYVSFTDIDQVKKVILELQTLQHAMEIASNAGKIDFWRYNIETEQILRDLLEYSKKGYPNVMDNVPTSLEQLGYIPEEDFPLVRQMHESLKNDAQFAECTIRMKNLSNGKMEWQHIIYARLEDSAYNVKMAIGCSVNVDLLQEHRHRYENELQLRREIIKDSISYYQINLSKGVFEEFYSKYNDMPGVQAGIAVDDDVRKGILSLIDDDYKDVVQNTVFSQALLDAYNRGERELSIVYRRIIPDLGLRWVKLIATIMARPDTGDIIGFIHNHDIDMEKKDKMAVESIIGEEIEVIIVLKVKSALAHVVQIAKSISELPIKEEFCFEEKYVEVIRGLIYDADITQSDNFFCVNKLVEALTKESVIKTIFRTKSLSKTLRRKEIRAFYLDYTNEEIVLICRDITDLYEEEQRQKHILEEAAIEANKANKAKSEFLSSMSHDMRTPLNAVLALSREDMTANAEESELRSFLGKIHESGLFLLGIINDVLDMSKIERKKMTLKPTRYSIEEFEKYMSVVIGELCNNKTLEFTVDREGASQRRIWVDKVRLNQIFVNILSNSVKYTRSGGKVQLKMYDLQPPKDGIILVRFIVSDTGVGMSPEFLPKAFDSFTQEYHNGLSGEQGTGLGLAIVQELVTLMNGTIKIESALNVGTTVTVDLPLTIDDTTEDNSKNNVDYSKLKGKRVLLCEDNLLNAEIAVRLLSMKGIECMVARNGKEGVELFSNSTIGYFDFVLMDIRMPVLNGLEATKAIRALAREDSNVPIVAMTADAFTQDESLVLLSDMNAHVSKPIDPAMLFEVLCKLCK